MTHRRWPTSLVAEQDTDLAEAAVEIQSLMEELRLAEKEIDRLAGQITEAAALHQAGVKRCCCGVCPGCRGCGRPWPCPTARALGVSTTPSTDSEQP